MVVPRYFWGIAINYIATYRASFIYFGHMRSGKQIGWDKTNHEFPEEYCIESTVLSSSVAES